MLVEGRQPLRVFLRELPLPPFYRLVLSDRAIDAIVTPSDANKLPVRLVAFTMVVHLETAMLNVARLRADGDDEVAILELDEGGFGQVMDLHRRMAERRLNVSPLEVTTLKQKGQILVGQGVFADEEEAMEDFTAIYEQLRNPLVHLSPYVSDSFESLSEFTRNMERMDDRTSELEALLAGRRR
jgi:hypothetical protein